MAKRDDPVPRIVRFNGGRDAERLGLKYKAMAENALGFLRGTCHLFAEDWDVGKSLSKAPSTWVCGDLHIENLGSYKGDNRLVYFDIADFDEALLAPCTWDITRLAVSAFVAARVYGLNAKTARKLSGLFVTSYSDWLRIGTPRWIERDTAVGAVAKLLRALALRKRIAFIKARTVLQGSKRKLLIDGKHTLAASAAERKRVKDVIAKFAEDRSDRKFFRCLDVARRIAGTGALGLERWVILIEGRGDVGGQFLLDLKFAAPSALAGHVHDAQPKWSCEAARIVAVQRRMQAIPPALLHPVILDRESFVLRELMPSQDKIDFAGIRNATTELPCLAADFGALLAWAQLRSSGRDGSAIIDDLIAFAEKERWKRDVLDYAEQYAQVVWSDWKEFRSAFGDRSLIA